MIFPVPVGASWMVVLCRCRFGARSGVSPLPVLVVTGRWVFWVVLLPLGQLVQLAREAPLGQVVQLVLVVPLGLCVRLAR